MQYSVAVSHAALSTTPALQHVHFLPFSTWFASCWFSETRNFSVTNHLNWGCFCMSLPCVCYYNLVPELTALIREPLCFTHSQFQRWPSERWCLVLCGSPHICWWSHLEWELQLSWYPVKAAFCFSPSQQQQILFYYKVFTACKSQGMKNEVKTSSYFVGYLKPAFNLVLSTSVI